MRLLANENFPLEAVQALRLAGHDAAWIREDAPGSPDDAVLSRAARERRLLLTFDKDFGALVFRRGANASNGIVLFRVILPPHKLAQFVVATLAAR
jgi:predicted nuclease of predicted toxin-antitoxin system